MLALHTPRAASLAALLTILAVGCATPDAGAEPPQAPAPQPPAPQPPAPQAPAQPQPPPPTTPAPLAPVSWRLEPGALSALDEAARLGALEATAAAIGSEERALAALAAGDAAAATSGVAAIASDTARLAGAVRAALLAVAGRERARAGSEARLVRDEAEARERLRAALADASAVAPVGTRGAADLAVDVRALEAERAALLQRLAAPAAEPLPLPEPGATAEGARLLVARLAATLAHDDLAPEVRGVCERAARVARALLDTAVAGAVEAGRALEAERAARRRERDVARLTDEAVGLELERARRRQDEEARAQAEALRRDEDAVRLARREQDVAAQLHRLQALLDQAERRRGEEAAAIAAIQSRTAALDGDQDPALRGHRATLADLQRRLDGARRIRDAAAGDLQALRGAIGVDPHGELRDGFAARLAAGEVAWEVAHDAAPLRALVAALEAAGADTRARAEAHTARAAAADRAATDADASVEASREDGRRRAAYLGVAPPAHRPLLEAIEDVRAMLEATRREEARHRRDEARALAVARARLEADLVILDDDLLRALAAWQRTEDERRLDVGTLRRSGTELRALLADARADLEGRAARLASETTAAGDERARRWGGLLLAALVVALVAWRVRARLLRRAQVIVDRKLDPATKTIARPVDLAAFVTVYVAAASVPWLALVVLVGLTGAALDLERGVARRLLVAAGVLLLARALGALDHLLFRDGRLRALVAMRPENRLPIHRRLQVALWLLGPLAAAHVLVRDRPELWATAIVTQGLLAMGVVLTLLAVLQVARGDVGRALRFVLPAAPAGPARGVVHLAKAGYNRVIDGLLGLLLLDLLAMLALWSVGWVGPAALLLRGTVQTVLTVTCGVLLLVGLRGGARLLLDGAVREARRPGVQVLASVAVFVSSRLLELALLGAVALSLWDAWGGDARPVLGALRSERTLGVAIAAAKIVAAIAVGYYANQLVGYGIDGFVEQTLRTADAEVARRRDTFVPLVKSAVRYLVILATVLYSATQAGFDLVSIFAGLGVLGLAVAFGAQTLVKDVITGIFVIVDDDLAVGDVVRLGAVEGTVEHVGVRTTKVRTLQGVLVSIPNGSIAQVENWNRGWNRAVLDLPVAYEADVDKAMVVLKEVAEEYRRQRPDLIIDAPEVQGVVALEQAVVVRLRVRTAPLAVWQVERELRLRAFVAFEDQGLEIPYDRRVVVVRTEGPDGQLLPVSFGGALEARPAPAAAAPQAVPSAAPGVLLPPGVTLDGRAGVDGRVGRDAHDGREDEDRAGGAGAAPSLEPAWPAAMKARRTGRLDAREVAARLEAAARGASPASPATDGERPASGRLRPDALTSPPTASTPPAPVALGGASPPGGDAVAPRAVLVDPSGQPISPEPPRTRRVVLSRETMQRLRDSDYVRSANVEEPVVPDELKASMAAIEQARVTAEAAREKAAAAAPATAAPAAPTDDAPRTDGPGAEHAPPSAASLAAAMTASAFLRRATDGPPPGAAPAPTSAPPAVAVAAPTPPAAAVPALLMADAATPATLLPPVHPTTAPAPGSPPSSRPDRST